MNRSLSRRELLRSGGGTLVAAAIAPLAACTTTLAVAPPAQTTEPVPVNYASILDRYVAQYAAAAPFTSAALYVDGVALLRGYESGKPSSKPKAGWVFGIGSNTKLFTSTLLAYQCVGSAPSKRLSDSVVPYLPAEVAQSGTPQIKATTLVELATHTASFPHSIPQETDDTLFIDQPPTQPQIEWWVNWKNAGSVNPNNKCAGATPGTCWQYSDWGFVTLGFAVAHSNEHAGAKYNELLASHVTTPLGMPNTSAQAALSVQGHLQNGTVVTPPPPDLKSNASDMLTFLKANLGAVASIPARLADALALTRAVHWRGPQQNMGLAWQSRIRPGPRRRCSGNSFSAGVVGSRFGGSPFVYRT